MSTDFGYFEPVTVHFDDLDAMGVLHNARYALLVERAYVTYWTRQGFGYTGSQSPPDAFAVVREFFITYHVPVRQVGPLGVHLWTERIGTSSTTIGFQVLSGDRTTVHADGHRVHIKLDPATMRPSPWSAEARELASALARPGRC
ncbi:MAG: acyl-CoA thioesterase [Dactylosporangium sp.]|nr:acyl-CoA thioesterase [Dactylosporangium sp.]NNJ61655.1 acyl-CoA thioesterase [Dactylosporangium sp.]